MKYFKILVWFLLLSVLSYATPLPYGLAQHISSIPLNKNNYSIHIQEVDSSRPLVEWNSHKKRSPASVIKLLTTYSSLLELGFDYRWETKFYHTGSLKHGKLRGDFIVKASGDPTLRTSDVDEIVSQLKARGIRSISGNIIIDRTLFNVSTKNNSGFDKNLYSPYNAMPDAMMFNERKSTICVTARGKSVRISKDVPDKSYKVVNKLRVVNGSCRGSRSWPRLRIKKNTMILSGKISKHCSKRRICKVVTKPYYSFYYTLRDKMRRAGIKVSGKMKLKRTPRKATYLFSHFSTTLERIISKTAKKSNNLYARQLLLTLGAIRVSAPSTPFKGRTAIEKILNQYYILEKGKTYIENGSGLSRRSKLTAQSLANLLLHGYKTYGQRWMDTLSIAGIDGTIHNRFKHSSVFGRAWMKTGTIKRVANIAGYVEGISGRRYVVVVLVNDKYSARYGRRLANKVIKWVADTK